MGKIRIKTLGDEEIEKEQKNELKKKREQKKLTKTPGLKGGSALLQGRRVVEVGPSAEELEKAEVKIEQPQEKPEEKKVKTTKKKDKFVKKQTRSDKYKKAVVLVEKNKFYPLSEALELLPKVQMAKFDETVELHINLNEGGVSGSVNLPHGSGKKTRVAIATDELIKQIEKGLPASADAQASGRRGKIDFDILLAKPDMMPKLAKVARFLGPKGLMPNPKNGTITQNPESIAKKYEGGHMNFKSEAKAPIVHMIVGKMSFGDKKLEENIKAALKAVQIPKIKNVTLKSTMSPGIKLNFSSLGV
ncbi:MAG: 50S ribosomal protein L1 [Patescibacteria group bacterium]|nr:50S ribosomal protein L1 [Patescibacteria group bacterium]